MLRNQNYVSRSLATRDRHSTRQLFLVGAAAILWERRDEASPASASDDFDQDRLLWARRNTSKDFEGTVELRMYT